MVKKGEDSSIRAAYEQYGADAFYRSQGDSYRNPHEAAIRRVLAHVVGQQSLDLSYVLDLACGSGEATLALRKLGARQIDGVDPYTYRAYEQRTGRAAERFSFEDVAAGVLAGRRYSLVACSFALHLLAASRLPLLCYHLAEISPALLVLTPHKRPDIREAWGWRLVDETVIERVRSRYYRRVSDPLPTRQ